MKHHFPTPPLAALLAPILLFTAGSLRAVPIKAQLSLKDEAQGEIATFVVSATKEGLMCSAFQNGQNPRLFPLADIKDISWVEPDDWTKAWDYFIRAQYKEAAEAMAQVYENYKGLIDLEDSYASRAKFYECESLRLIGEYAKLMEQYDTVKGVTLSSRFVAQVKLFNCWGHAGKELWAPLSRIMKDYEIDVADIPKETIPPTGLPFKKVAPREIIQISYLRGLATHKLLAAKQDKLAALIAKDDERDKLIIGKLTAEIDDDIMSILHDYSRGMTVTYGDEKVIMKNSMLNYLDLATEAEDFKENYIKQKEAHVVALLYSQLHGKLPSEFVPLLEEPKEPVEE